MFISIQPCLPLYEPCYVYSTLYMRETCIEKVYFENEKQYKHTRGIQLTRHGWCHRLNDPSHRIRNLHTIPKKTQDNNDICNITAGLAELSPPLPRHYFSLTFLYHNPPPHPPPQPKLDTQISVS